MLWSRTKWCDFWAHPPTDLRLPLGRYHKMMSFSCHLSMLSTKNGYAYRHNGRVSGDAWEAESLRTRLWGILAGPWIIPSHQTASKSPVLDYFIVMVNQARLRKVISTPCLMCYFWKEANVSWFAKTINPVTQTWSSDELQSCYGCQMFIHEEARWRGGEL